MIVTTEQARTMRCSNADQPMVHCSGDHCMGWRWVGLPTDKDQAERGYCGRAGAPPELSTQARLADATRTWPALLTPHHRARPLGEVRR